MDKRCQYRQLSGEFLRMRNSYFIKFAAAAILVFSYTGCASPPGTMVPPAQFKKYNSKNELKMITADGVRLKARKTDNYPEASLEFWTQAALQHLEKSGYNHLKTVCFKTQKNLDGCTLKFALPKGAEDWIFQETIFVTGKKLILIEATGEFSRFKAIDKDLDKALLTFVPDR
jgi:hypothetical protein